MLPFTYTWISVFLRLDGDFQRAAFLSPFYLSYIWDQPSKKSQVQLLDNRNLSRESQHCYFTFKALNQRVLPDFLMLVNLFRVMEQNNLWTLSAASLSNSLKQENTNIIFFLGGCIILKDFFYKYTKLKDRENKSAIRHNVKKKKSCFFLLCIVAGNCQIVSARQENMNRVLMSLTTPPHTPQTAEPTLAWKRIMAN